MGHTSGDDNIRFGAVIKAVDALGNTKLSGRAKTNKKRDAKTVQQLFLFPAYKLLRSKTTVGGR